MFIIHYLNNTLFKKILASAPPIETIMQWKGLAVPGDTYTLASTLRYCLNFQQGLKRDENSRPKLILPTDIKGKTKFDV